MGRFLGGVRRVAAPAPAADGADPCATAILLAKGDSSATAAEGTSGFGSPAAPSTASLFESASSSSELLDLEAESSSALSSSSFWLSDDERSGMMMMMLLLFLFVLRSAVTELASFNRSTAGCVCAKRGKATQGRRRHVGMTIVGNVV